MFDVSRISLVKQDGTRINDINAHVQPTMIFIDDASLPIEEGDRFLRRLPNGLEERYLILDRGYWDGPGMRPHYQVKVRKETSINVERQAATIYNVQGANPRVRVNSLDASVNVVTTSATRVFEQLKQAVTDNVPDDNHQGELLRHVEDLERAQGTGSFLERYQALIAVAADHLTLLSPFLPALTQLLQH
jgi:hypothetical protein